MQNLIYDAGASIQQLLDKGFQMPIHFAAVGTNGSVIAGTYNFSLRGRGFDCRITVQSNGNALMSPVNIMCVDRRGESAVVVLRRSPEAEPQTAVVA